jgi:hypothetical protein
VAEIESWSHDSKRLKYYKYFELKFGRPRLKFEKMVNITEKEALEFFKNPAKKVNG